jgi:endoglucanase
MPPIAPLGRPSSRVARTVAAVAAAAALAGTVATASAATSTATRAAARHAAARSSYVNPLVGHPWGIYTGGSDGLYPAYQAAHGATKRTLGVIARRPHVRWYTNYLADNEVKAKIQEDIAQEQHGDPDVLVWMATFRLWPHHESAKAQPVSPTAQASYRRWVRNAAAGIGSSRVALILEPDLPVSLKGWRPAVRMRLVRYAAKLFGSLPNTTVYLDAGSADWLKVPDEIAMLKQAGIGYVHGFALGSTHRTPLPMEIRYGRQVSMALAKAGYPDEHYIVDTSDNGRGYTWGEFYRLHPNGNFEAPPACHSPSQRACESLGVPPTTDVTNPKWGLPTSLDATLKARCDAFMWISRPWLADNAHDFSVQKTLAEVRSSPYFH